MSSVELRDCDAGPPVSRLARRLIARKAALALAIALLITACDGGGAPRDTPAREADTPTDSVLTEIRTSNDCAHLQNLFDVAAEAHDFASENNALDAMQAMTARMSAADKRMREIGCYD